MKWSWLKFILALALVSRLFFALVVLWSQGQEGFYSPDSSSYIQSALEIFKYQTFTQNGIKELARTPGYPLLLTFSHALGSLLLVTIVLQCLLSTYGIKLIHEASLLVNQNQKKAHLSAWLLAFEPLSVIYCSKILTETFFTVVLLQVFVLLLRKRKQVLLIVLCLSLLPLIRPISIFLPLLLVLSICIWYRDQWPVKHLVIILIVPFMCLGVWTARNYFCADYGFFSSINDVNLYRYHAAGVIAKRDQREMQDVQDFLDQQIRQQHFKNHAQRYKWMRDHAIDEIKTAPFIFCENYLWGILRASADPDATTFLEMIGLHQSRGLLNRSMSDGIVTILKEIYAEHPYLFWSTFLLAAYLLFLWLMGIFSLFENSKSPLIIIILIYFLMFSGGPQAHGRFRHPVMPFICLLVAGGVCRVRRTLKESKF